MREETGAWMAPVSCSCGFGLVGVLPRRVGFGLKPCEKDFVLSGTSTMAPPTSLHSFFRALTGPLLPTASHPDAVPEAALNLLRRIDDPASAARVARDLLRSRLENVTLVLYMDDHHHFAGHTVVAAGWVQAARLSATR